MTRLRVIISYIVLFLIAGCGSKERAANEKPATINPTGVGADRLSNSNRIAELIKALNSTNPSPYEVYGPFGESSILATLFNCADVAFKTENADFILLVQPEPLGRIHVSELDRIVAKPGLRKELAVVFVEYFWDRLVKTKEGEEEFWTRDPKQKATSQFVFEVDQKLAGAGFKRVIFAYKSSHGLYTRMPIGWIPTKEGAKSEERGADGKDVTVNPTNTASEVDPFEESGRLAQLMKRADLVLNEDGSGKTIEVLQPRHTGNFPVSELDGKLAELQVGKELAIVILGRWVWFDPKEKTIEEFAIWINKKLQTAGFKKIMFLSSYHGLYTQWKALPTPEEAQRARASMERFVMYFQTNRIPSGLGK